MSILIRTVAFTIAFMLTSYYLNPNLFNCYKYKDIENKDIKVINEYINKHMEYLRMYFSINLYRGIDEFYIIELNNKKYLKSKHCCYFSLFGRSADTDYSFESNYAKIISNHFIDMDTLLVVDEETELLLNMIK